MLKPHGIQGLVLSVVTAALTLALANVAMADTIYMKNGRSIRSSQVRIEGDQVIFLQYGGEVSIPMSMVDRIVQDENVEPEGAPPPPPAAADDTQVGPATDPEEEETPPEQTTRDYWQGKVRAITAEREEVELQIEDLRRTERAFLFSHRSTAETRTQIVAAQARLAELEQEVTDLQAEARRLNVPPGWLRLDPSR